MAHTELNALIVEDACTKAIADLTDAVTRGVQPQATLDVVRGMWAIAVASRLSTAGLTEPAPIMITGEEALLILDYIPVHDVSASITEPDDAPDQ